MARPSDFTEQDDTALVMVKSGTCLLTNAWTNRATATSESVPVVAVTAGTAIVDKLIGMGGNWICKPKVVRTGGNLTADATVTTA